MLYALTAFVVIDYISGITAAVINKRLSCKIGFEGILRKTMFFSVAAVSHMADTLMSLNGVLRSAVIGFLIANEGISILENSASCGVPYPDKLKAVLEHLGTGK